MLPWNEIDTVLLDMDGTLLDLHFDNHFWQDHLPKRYAEHHGVDLAAAQQHLEEHFKRMRGTLEWYSTRFWSEQLEVDIPALKREVVHKIALRPFVRTFLSKLHVMGKTVAVVTNAHQESIEIKISRTGLDALVHKIVSTHELGLAKEHPGFWEKLQQSLPFSPQRTTLIDDNLEALRCARNAGIAHPLAVPNPDSRQLPGSTAEFTPVSCFSELMRE